MITMTEIARLTGVSQPTVSRVLNGNTAVNPEIRERVLACAREHDFQPNVMAQSLVGSKTRLIGVIVTDISNSFFAELVKYIGEEARKDGYSLILFSSDYDLEKEKECLDVVKRYRVDGLIMVPVDENGAEWRGIVSRLDIPTVVITRHATGIDSFYVAHDEAGAQIAEQILRELSFDPSEIQEITSAIREHRNAARSDTLSSLIYDADKASRNCFSCPAEKECYWSAEKKNLTITY